MGQIVASVRRGRFWSALVALLAVFALVVGLSGCGAGSGSAPVQIIANKGTPYDDLLIPKVNASVKDGAIGIAVGTAVTVSAEDGVLDSVSMVNDYGGQVDGKFGPDERTWSTTEPLGYNKQYTVTASALGLAGETSKKISFRTHSPANLTMPYALPNSGEVVGVGQPVIIRFDENIADRAAAEKAITVTTEPEVDGAFYWLNGRELRWRPEHYWKPGTKVTVQAAVYGVNLGDGVFGQDSASTQFTIGDELIATADDATKMITVRANGAVVKVMPTSMGKDKTPTDNGIYIVGERFPHIVMDSSTYGVPVNSPDGYRTDVDWATQISYSGIFVHSAPWSVGAQGNTNTSHGCLNVSPADAQWFFDHTKRGDIVKVVNTVGPILPGVDGLGDWNVPWSQWEAGNANA